jgi:hypothetical protein
MLQTIQQAWAIHRSMVFADEAWKPFSATSSMTP